MWPAPQANNIAFQEIVMTVHQFEDNAAKSAQGYAINWDTAEARVKDLKAYLMNAPQVMDPERTPSGCSS